MKRCMLFFGECHLMSLLTIQALRRDMEEGKERARPEDGHEEAEAASLE